MVKVRAPIFPYFLVGGLILSRVLNFDLLSSILLAVGLASVSGAIEYVLGHRRKRVEDFRGSQSSHSEKWDKREKEMDKQHAS